MLLLTTVAAFAQSGVPNRQIPPAVLHELRMLENRFELALALDCAPERCFSKGCTYIEHQTADQPRGMSLPGLGGDPGPGSVPPQEFLTRARCNFVHEKNVETKDVQALSRRLQAKLSQAWTSVSIGHQALPEIPQYLLDQPEPEPVEDTDVPEEPEPEPEIIAEPEWSLNVASRELWVELLPHAWWMVLLLLGTLATTALIWAFRRVGAKSVEEQALLASLMGAEPDDDGSDEPEAVNEPADTSSVERPVLLAQELGSWRKRLSGMDPERPDPEIQALIRELLLAGELPLLAKAVLTFPSTFPAAFPQGGAIASAKLELADYLKGVDAEHLPSDEEFVQALNRHALSASLSIQSDADVVRSLREEFGAAGLVDLIGQLPARAGALLFSLAPSREQTELVRLLTPRQATALAEQLLRSNRMDESETRYLFDVLESVRHDETLPAPPAGEVSDRGPTHDATGALSVLLPRLDSETRSALFQAALQRFNGSLPSWYRGIFYGEMLLALDAETRNDLMLEIDNDHLAAWFRTLDADVQFELKGSMPNALRAAIDGAPALSEPSRQLAMAQQGRRELAKGFQRKLTRTQTSFESVLDGTASA